jgi:hypothetical protein
VYVTGKGLLPTAMQVYVGLNLGIDTEGNNILAVASPRSRERSGPQANDSEVLDIRPDSDKRVLSPQSHEGGWFA